MNKKRSFLKELMKTKGVYNGSNQGNSIKIPIKLK